MSNSNGQVQDKDKKVVLLDDIINPTGKDSDRLTLRPIRHQDLWELHKKGEACFWTADELKLARDISDWEDKLTPQEREYLENILAFFASSDGIVIENLVQRFANEVQFVECKAFYAFQGYIETVHCVSGDTRILTDKGYLEIGGMANKQVNVWNGEEWAPVTVKKTSDKSQLTTVKLSNGMTLRCTQQHKWYLEGKEEPVYTENLKIGNQLQHWVYSPLPDKEGSKKMDNPYTFGYVFGQRHRLTNKEKSQLVAEKSHLEHLDFLSCETRQNSKSVYVRVKPRYYGSDDYVPYNFDQASRTMWLKGAWDACGSVEQVDSQTRYIFNIKSTSCARNLQLMLTTFGVHSTNHGRYVSMSKQSANVLFMTTGVKLSIDLGQPDYNDSPNLDAIVTVTGLTADEEEPTYCFTEPKRSRGTFNGILTGQSETYSLFIDTLVKDKARQKFLLEGIENIPAIRKKADWAMKWIASEEANFGERLFAFACVEGVFFSGSFAAIYWLKSRGLMKGLAWANDKIMSDEGLHTEFACKILRDHLVHQRPSEERVHEIMREAVEIECEFQTKSFPCPFPEFNAERMTQYVKHVGDKVLEMAGYKTIYNVTCPLEFMNTISLRTMSNQFERDNPSYRLPQGEKKFELKEDF